MNSFDYIRPERLNNSRILSWFTYKNPEYRQEGATIEGLNLGFNTKDQQRHVLENIHRLGYELDINRKDLALAHQVHGTEIQHVEQGGFYEGSDAFVCNTPGLSLGIQVADCAAVLLGDFENSVIGVAHAGWRGAVGGIVPKTVEAIIDLGAEISQLEIFLSPCLGKHNFEVGEEVAERFPEVFVDRKNYPKPHVDLTGLIVKQLAEKGVQESQVEVDGRCTIDHDQQFYSYRREKEESGRMLGLIKLTKL